MKRRRLSVGEALKQRRFEEEQEFQERGERRESVCILDGSLELLGGVERKFQRGK